MSAPIQIRRCEAHFGWKVKGRFFGIWGLGLERYGKMKTHLFQSSRYDILTGFKVAIYIFLLERNSRHQHPSFPCPFPKETPEKLRWQSQHVMHWASSSFTLVFSVGLHVSWASWPLAWPAAFVVSAVTPRWTQRWRWCNRHQWCQLQWDNLLGLHEAWESWPKCWETAFFFWGFKAWCPPSLHRIQNIRKNIKNAPKMASFWQRNKWENHFTWSVESEETIPPKTLSLWCVETTDFLPIQKWRKPTSWAWLFREKEFNPTFLGGFFHSMKWESPQKPSKKRWQLVAQKELRHEEGKGKKPANCARALQWRCPFCIWNEWSIIVVDSLYIASIPM